MRRGDFPLERIFTPQEIAYAAGKKRQYEHFAARFAAKEAFLKAAGIGLGGGIDLVDIGVCHHRLSGKPYLELAPSVQRILASSRILSIDLSLSHTEEYAVAQVVMILDEREKG